MSGALPSLGDRQVPISWVTDAKRVFTEKTNATEAIIYRVDRDTGHRELWQTIKSKDQIGLELRHNPVAVTPDGWWTAYS